MGEIGFQRREFLYDLKWWEVKSIIRGYNARHHAGWEQARLVAYSAHYCNGVPKGHTAPTVNEWIKFSWEHDTAADGTPSAQPSEADIAELRRIMAEENARAEAAAQAK